MGAPHHGLCHDTIGPVIIVRIGPYRNQLRPFPRIAAQEAGIIAEGRGIAVGGHVAAAAPTFIADADEGDCPWFGMSIGGAASARLAGGRRGHVSHPVVGFPDAARSDIDRHKGLGPDLVEKIHIFMRAEGVGFG